MKIDRAEIRKMCKDEEKFSAEIIEKIKDNNWLNIWIPEKFGGENLSLPEGLKFLKELAHADGSLGWTVTLCCGANYFARNLKPETALEMFNKSTFFGGSGMIGGTAEKTENGYLLNGKWKYATGAPFLSHFTMNAWITENGKEITNEKGEKIFKSFVVQKELVKVIADWNTMGMKATATHSFEIEKVMVPEEHSFTYNHFYGEDVLDKIPFLTFADFTLAINYIGMAQHFAEAFETENSFTHKVSEMEQQILNLSDKIQNDLMNEKNINDDEITDIHRKCSEIIKKLSGEMLIAYTGLGLKVCQTDSEYNRVFRDFFTATQHSHFRMKETETR